MTTAIDFSTRLRRPRVLSPEQEVAVVARARAGSKAARDELFLANMGHVWSIAYQFARKCPRIPIEDFAMQGALGLHRAWEKFEPERGQRFLTYAAWWIRAFMFRLVQRPKHEQGVRLISLETPVHAAYDGNDVTLEDTLATDDPSQEEMTIARDDMRFARTKVLRAIAMLPTRQRYIVGRRYLDEDGADVSLAELGRELSLSRERVRQLENDAMRRMRELLR